VSNVTRAIDCGHGRWPASRAWPRGPGRQRYRVAAARYRGYRWRTGPRVEHRLPPVVIRDEADAGGRL